MIRPNVNCKGILNKPFLNFIDILQLSSINKFDFMPRSLPNQLNNNGEKKNPKCKSSVVSLIGMTSSKRLFLKRIFEQNAVEIEFQKCTSHEHFIKLLCGLE